MPEKPTVVIVNALGNSFGVIGSLVEATRASAATNEAVAELAAGNLDYKTYLPAQIDGSLKAQGFETQILTGGRPENAATKFLAVLPDAPGADAVLDTYVSFLGYAAADARTPYRPAVHIEARLTDIKTNKILFADQIYYNNFVPAAAKTAITIEPDSKAVFADRAAMKAAPPDVANALRVAIDAVSNQLAQQFK